MNDSTKITAYISPSSCSKFVPDEKDGMNVFHFPAPPAGPTDGQRRIRSDLKFPSKIQPLPR
jgi:hypothetical protein